MRIIVVSIALATIAFSGAARADTLTFAGPQQAATFANPNAAQYPFGTNTRFNEINLFGEWVGGWGVELSSFFHPSIGAGHVAAVWGEGYGMLLMAADGGTFDFYGADLGGSFLGQSVGGYVSVYLDGNDGYVGASMNRDADFSYDFFFGKTDRLDLRVTHANVKAVRFTAGMGGFYLDNVQTSLNSVPEPATWAMMLGGFALVGSAVRRRSRVDYMLA